MNLQEELKALKERVAELEEQVKKEQDFPQKADMYWLIEETLGVSRYVWDGDDFDNKLLSVGNVFRTKEQAEFALEKLKVEAELRKFSRPFKEDKNNYFIEIDLEDKLLSLDASKYFQTQGTIYFETANAAFLAVETVGADRIKKYIFGVED